MGLTRLVKWVGLGDLYNLIARDGAKNSYE